MTFSVLFSFFNLLKKRSPQGNFFFNFNYFEWGKSTKVTKQILNELKLIFANTWYPQSCLNKMLLMLIINKVLSSCHCYTTVFISRCKWFMKISVCMCLVAHSCPTLCDSMDCSLPGSPIPIMLFPNKVIFLRIYLWEYNNQM